MLELIEAQWPHESFTSTDVYDLFNEQDLKRFFPMMKNPKDSIIHLCSKYAKRGHLAIIKEHA